jgi:hypothetical protein
MSSFPASDQVNPIVPLLWGKALVAPDVVWGFTTECEDTETAFVLQHTNETSGCLASYWDHSLQALPTTRWSALCVMMPSDSRPVMICWIHLSPVAVDGILAQTSSRITRHTLTPAAMSIDAGKPCCQPCKVDARQQHKPFLTTRRCCQRYYYHENIIINAGSHIAAVVIA